MDCPNCQSPNIRRSPRRGLAEGLLLRLLRRAPWRCNACGLRFVGATVAGSAPARRRPRSLLSYLGLDASLELQLSIVIGLATLLIAILVIGAGLNLLEDIPVATSASLR